MFTHVSFYFQGGDASVNSVHLFPKNTDHIVVCNKTSSIFIMTLQGQVLWMHILFLIWPIFLPAKWRVIYWNLVHLYIVWKHNLPSGRSYLSAIFFIMLAGWSFELLLASLLMLNKAIYSTFSNSNNILCSLDDSPLTLKKEKKGEI